MEFHAICNRNCKKLRRIAKWCPIDFTNALASQKNGNFICTPINYTLPAGLPWNFNVKPLASIFSSVIISQKHGTWAFKPSSSYSISLEHGLTRLHVGTLSKWRGRCDFTTEGFKYRDIKKKIKIPKNKSQESQLVIHEVKQIGVYAENSKPETERGQIA